MTLVRERYKAKSVANVHSSQDANEIVGDDSSIHRIASQILLENCTTQTACVCCGRRPECSVGNA
jgi:hypothetical protein